MQSEDDIAVTNSDATTFDAAAEKEATDETKKNVVDNDDGKNFTWEHFFRFHCGILKEDASAYEKHLISQRMDPKTCLPESLDLVIKCGRIPVGDAIKIKKLVERKQHALEENRKDMKKARERFGLGDYSDLEARIILILGNGDTEDHIDYGIEQWEEGKEELKRAAQLHMIKHGPKAHCVGVGHVLDPTFVLLTQGFGYETFDYTKGKDVGTPCDPSLKSTLADVESALASVMLTNEAPVKLEEHVKDMMYS